MNPPRWFIAAPPFTQRAHDYTRGNPLCGLNAPAGRTWTVERDVGAVPLCTDCQDVLRLGRATTRAA